MTVLRNVAASLNVDDTTWRKSSRSEAQNACVELAVGSAHTYIRDTKNREAGCLTFGDEYYRAFLAAVRGGRWNA